MGEGTSSIVRRGEWHGQPVAIKMYKAALSSDGMNLDEVRASCAVDHAHVLRWLGYLSEGAEQISRASSASAGWRLVGVLEWAPGFSSLGGPPSMTSITRDTYPATARFSGAEVRDIARGIASALEHLHGRGLAHGDVYAHNILWKGAVQGAAHGRAHHSRRHHHHTHRQLVHREHEGADGDGRAIAKLSDFGAAFYYGVGDAHALSYERFEQRAFGLLLEELLERHDGSEKHLLGPVRRAAAAAAADDPTARPGFAALVKELEVASDESENASQAPERGRGLGGRRPRSTFGRVLPREHPQYADRGV